MAIYNFAIRYDTQRHDIVSTRIRGVRGVPAARGTIAIKKLMSVEFEQLVDKPKSKSKVWKHFGFPADVDGAIKHKKNRLCEAVVAYSGNTTNLSHHLQRSQWREFSELSERGGDKPGPSISPTAKQLTLPDAIERSISFPHDSEKHRRLVNATADLFARACSP